MRWGEENITRNVWVDVYSVVNNEVLCFQSRHLKKWNTWNVIKRDGSSLIMMIFRLLPNKVVIDVQEKALSDKELMSWHSHSCSFIFPFYWKSIFFLQKNIRLQFPFFLLSASPSSSPPFFPTRSISFHRSLEKKTIFLKDINKMKGNKTNIVE